jgi:glycosyltransferase involved in cell wall biosynthesis
MKSLNECLMISIIICSRGDEYRRLITENVAETVGIPYELVIIDNSTNEYGICSAYNEGAARSKYDILCFAHEDILIRTPEWGKIVAQTLQDSSIGALGIAGGKWIAKVPSSWWGCGNKHLSINLHDQGVNQEYSQYTYSNPENKLLVDVAAVDGMWICSRKEVWQQFPFDDKYFREFHFYDIDYCANMLYKYRVCVTFDINITHFSRGNFNDSWFKNADKFYRKYEHKLPLGIVHADSKEVEDREYEVCKNFVLEVIKRRFTSAMGFKYLANCIKIRTLDRNTFWLVRSYMLYAAKSLFRF